MWTRSIAKLSEILGKEVTAASVPGGYFSRRVAEFAAAAGIRALFTSEPTKISYLVNGCRVFGRYTLMRHMGPAVSGQMGSSGYTLAQARQYLQWNTKKVFKSVGGDAYLAIRAQLLGRE